MKLYLLLIILALSLTSCKHTNTVNIDGSVDPLLEESIFQWLRIKGLVKSDVSWDRVLVDWRKYFIVDSPADRYAMELSQADRVLHNQGEAYINEVWYEFWRKDEEPSEDLESWIQVVVNVSTKKIVRVETPTLVLIK